MSSAVVFGAYGTFGALVARELAGRGIALVIAGRDPARAQAFARGLGPPHRGLAADLRRPDSCRAALRGQTVAVNCAGPFAGFGPTLLEACLEAGCHYADIADDRNYTALVRGRSEAFRGRGLAAVHGCSSLPAISGALSLMARAGATSPPRRARVTLFIGNDNPKGPAAVEALARVLGRPIRTPQGVVKGFRDREVVPLPEPFGPRAAYNFESPEYDLFPGLLGLSSVSVKVGFESALATNLLALLALLPAGHGRGIAALLGRLSNRFRTGGSSGGAVMTELFFADGSVRRATLVAKSNGQHMAALPCTLVAQALCAGTHQARGAMTAYEFLGATPLLEHLVATGVRIECTPGPGKPPASALSRG